MTDQLTYSDHELLASHEFAEPLIAGGVRCHGGFDDSGSYVSPRTLHRGPAIEAWQERHRNDFGTEILDIALEEFPAHFPNVDQAALLIKSGSPEPVISTLTRIGTVEGFGSMLRYSIVPDLQRFFEEDLSGTATQHLDRGLIEAHARDEAGHEDEAGHNRMWFAARDIAFENPVTEDQTALMLERMGISAPGSTPPDPEKIREAARALRFLPDDIDLDLEGLLARMIRLLLIEISAFHAFRWAEAVLDDRSLVAGDGDAARIVSYIRSDETPHVRYLETVLTEMRDRTFVGDTGARHSGEQIIGSMWERALAESQGPGRNEFLNMIYGEVVHALEPRANGADLIQEFNRLGDVRRLDDGTWTRPEAA
jgi:hypothetical protein